MPKYCNNCQATKQTWEEVRGASSCTNASDRCWSCDKYEMTPSNSSLVRASNFGGSSRIQELSRQFASDTSPNASVRHRREIGDLRSGEYYCEILQADKKQGYYHYEYTEYKRG